MSDHVGIFQVVADHERGLLVTCAPIDNSLADASEEAALLCMTHVADIAKAAFGDGVYPELVTVDADWNARGRTFDKHNKTGIVWYVYRIQGVTDAHGHVAAWHSKFVKAARAKDAS